MILWTVQPEEVYKVLQETGRFVCDINKSENATNSDGSLDANFVKAYKWLSWKLEKKCAKPEGVKFPIWAWYEFDGRNEMPNLGDYYYESSVNQDLVMIEVEIPDEQIVLSCEFDWTVYCLNDAYYNDGNDYHWDEINKWYESLSSEEKEREKLKSWEKVLVVDGKKWVQAIFWELRREQIRKVVHFRIEDFTSHEDA